MVNLGPTHRNDGADGDVEEQGQLAEDDVDGRELNERAAEREANVDDAI